LIQENAFMAYNQQYWGNMNINYANYASYPQYFNAGATLEQYWYLTGYQQGFNACSIMYQKEK
jgi:hypothetical protein